MHHPTKKTVILAGLLAVAVTAGGCTVDQQIRGYIINKKETEGVTAGFDNMSSVVNLLGNPSMVGTFNEDVWYYINEQAIRRAFFKPTAKERTILAIHFDEAGLVEEVKTFSLADARKINPRDDTTPTRGKKLGFFEQIFGNIGRFSGTPGQSQRQ